MPVDPSSFSHNNSNVSHSFYKNLGTTFLKSYNWQEVHVPGDERWMGIIDFEVSLSDCMGTWQSLNCKVAPQPLFCILSISSIQGWVFGTYQKGKTWIFLNLPESIYEIALTIINRMWILYFSDTTLSHRMTFWVRRDLKDHLYFTLRKR